MSGFSQQLPDSPSANTETPATPKAPPEPPTPLTRHLFVGNDPTNCGICHQFRCSQAMHIDWDYVPPVKADELEDAHAFKGTGETCAECGRAASHLIHGLHPPETGEPSLEERKVEALEDIASYLCAILEALLQSTTTIDGGERVVRVWTHNRERTHGDL